MTRLEDLREQYGTDQIWAWPEAHPQLFDLVAQGLKRATTAYFPTYEKSGRPMPAVGSYHILLDSIRAPKRALVLQWSEVRNYPFNQVKEDVAPAEHLSDEQWRKGYKSIFSKEAEQLGRSFSEQDRVVTRFFTVVESTDLAQ